MKLSAFAFGSNLFRLHGILVVNNDPGHSNDEFAILSLGNTVLDTATFHKSIYYFVDPIGKTISSDASPSYALTLMFGEAN